MGVSDSYCICRINKAATVMLRLNINRPGAADAGRSKPHDWRAVSIMNASHLTPILSSTRGTATNLTI
jgi:hypothetical protein